MINNARVPARGTARLLRLLFSVAAARGASLLPPAKPPRHGRLGGGSSTRPLCCRRSRGCRPELEGWGISLARHLPVAAGARLEPGGRPRLCGGKSSFGQAEAEVKDASGRGLLTLTHMLLAGYSGSGWPPSGRLCPQTQQALGVRHWRGHLTGGVGGAWDRRAADVSNSPCQVGHIVLSNGSIPQPVRGAPRS